MSNGEVLQCLKFRDRFVECLVWDTAPSRGLLRQISQSTVTVEALAISGLPQLLKLPELMAKCDSTTATLARAAIEAWRVQFQQTPKGERTGTVCRILGDLSVSTFNQKVFNLAEWLTMLDGSPVGVIEASTKRVAMRLVWNRLYGWEHLDSLLPEEVVEFGDSDAERAMLRRAVAAATTRGDHKRRYEAGPPLTGASSSTLACIPTSSPSSSSTTVQSLPSSSCALSLADRLTVEQVRSAEDFWAQELTDSGVPGFGKAKPSDMIRAMRDAQSRGTDVQTILSHQSKLIQAETRRHSLPSTASALKAWHGFAVDVLHYGGDASFPPGRTSIS